MQTRYPYFVTFSDITTVRSGPESGARKHYTHSHSVWAADEEGAFASVEGELSPSPTRRRIGARRITGPMIERFVTRTLPPDEDDECPESELYSHDMYEITPDGSAEFPETVAEAAAAYLQSEFAGPADGDWFDTGEPYTVDYRTGETEETTYHLHGFSRGEEDNLRRMLDD